MTTTSEQVTVTQADRDAAAKLAEDQLQGWCSIGGNDLAAIRNGFWDDTDEDLGAIVRAFARHRTQSQPSSDALSTAVQTSDSAFHERGGSLKVDTREAVIEECARVAEQGWMPAYVRFEDGEWTPGSPYDRGAVDARDRIVSAIRKLTEEPKS